MTKIFGYVIGQDFYLAGSPSLSKEMLEKAIPVSKFVEPQLEQKTAEEFYDEARSGNVDYKSWKQIRRERRISERTNMGTRFILKNDYNLVYAPYGDSDWSSVTWNAEQFKTKEKAIKKVKKLKYDGYIQIVEVLPKEK